MFKERTLHQKCVYCLSLNSVYANAEQGSIRAAATTEEALRNFYEGEFLKDPENINGYHLTFKEGPLRHSNPLSNWHHIDDNLMGWNQGWFEYWTEDPYTADSDIFRVDF